MTNNPEKIEAMKSAGIDVVERLGIEIKPTKANRDYLAAKKSTLRAPARIRLGQRKDDMYREIIGKLDAGNRRFALVVGRFNDFITSRLEGGAVDCISATAAPRKTSP